MLDPSDESQAEGGPPASDNRLNQPQGRRMAYKYSVHNPAKFTDDEIAEGVDYGNLLSAEVLPDDPPTPLEVALAGHRAIPARYRRVTVRVRDENGRLIAGTGYGIDPDHRDNPDIMWGGINVLPEHRRKGIATQLLAYRVAFARAEAAERLIGGTNERVPAGASFAQAVGAESKMADHLNHLPLAEVDRPMLERWVEEGPRRAPDYELIAWDNVVPEEHMENYLALVLVMNTAPRDDLKMNDFTITAKEVREGEDRLAAVKGEHWTLVARRVSDGDWAGFHDVSWLPSDPKVVWVQSTGVRPEHRGHALGKWLKAAMNIRVLDERPDVTEIRTGNADSNDAMLGINKAMGYRPMISSTTWEVPVDKVEAWLAERGVEIPELPNLS